MMAPPSPQPSAPGSSILDWSTAGFDLGVDVGATTDDQTDRKGPSAPPLTRRPPSNEPSELSEQRTTQGHARQWLENAQTLVWSDSPLVPRSAGPRAANPILRVHESPSPSRTGSSSPSWRSPRQPMRSPRQPRFSLVATEGSENEGSETSGSETEEPTPAAALDGSWTSMPPSAPGSLASSMRETGHAKDAKSTQAPVDLSASLLDASAEINWLVQQRSVTQEARTAARAQASPTTLLMHPEEAQGW